MLFIALLQDTGIELNNDEQIDALLQRLAKGDKDALTDLYNKTRAAIYGFSLSITKNASDAEDVLQDTYIKAWMNAGSYSSKGTPMAWLMTIAKNLSLMKLREKKRHQDLEPEEWDMNFHIPDTAENTEARHFLMEALKILTEEERQIIMLHAVSGLKHREIADLLELALATVLSKYHRALKKLRIYMEGEGKND